MVGATCQVAGCRHYTTHATSGHKCGRCGRFGHGQIECGRPSRIDLLQNLYGDDVVAVACTVEGCNAPWTHSSAAHHCERCRNRPSECQCQPMASQASALTSVPTSVPTNSQATVYKCPTCRSSSRVDLTMTLFTGAECVVCLESKPLTFFSGCRHATVCADCVVHL